MFLALHRKFQAVCVGWGGGEFVRKDNLSIKRFLSLSITLV